MSSSTEQMVNKLTKHLATGEALLRRYASQRERRLVEGDFEAWVGQMTHARPVAAWVRTVEDTIANAASADLYLYDFRNPQLPVAVTRTIANELEYKLVALRNIIQDLRQGKNADQEASIWLTKEGQNLYIECSYEKKMLCHFQAESTPERVLHYLFNNPNEKISLATLRNEVGHAVETRSIGDLLRKSGFSKSLKKYFFPISKRDEVMLTPAIKLGSQEVKKIMKDVNTANKTES